jgi:hypothetical protein
MNRFCSECGNVVEPDTKFCGNCGTGATASPQAPVTSIAVPQPSSASTTHPDGHSSMVLPAPPSLHWGVLLALTLVTFGEFPVIWGVVLAIWLKRLTGTWKPLIWFSIVGVLDAAWVVMAIRNPKLLDISSSGSGAFLTAFAVFSLRRHVVKHYNTIEPINLKISGWKTFFGSIFYLQYRLTKIARLKREQPQLFAPYAIPQLSYKEQSFDGRFWLRFAGVFAVVAVLVVLLIYIGGSRNGTAAARQSAPQASTVTPKPALDPQPLEMVRFDSAHALLEGEERVRGKLISMKATVSSVDDDKIDLATGDDFFNWSVVCQPPPDQRERILALKQGQDIVLVGIVPTDGATQLREPSSEHAGLYELQLTECRLP